MSREDFVVLAVLQGGGASVPRGLSPGDSSGDTFLSKHFNSLASQGALQRRTFLPAQMYPEPDILEQTQQHFPCFLSPVSHVFDINAHWMLYAKGYVLISANKSRQFPPTVLQNLPFSSNYHCNNFKPQTTDQKVICDS